MPPPQKKIYDLYISSDPNADPFKPSGGPPAAGGTAVQEPGIGQSVDAVEPAVGQTVDANEPAVGQTVSAVDSAPPGPKSVTDQAWDFAKNVVKAGPIGMVTGGAEAIGHPIDTAKGMLQSNQHLFDEAKAAVGRGDYGQAAVKSLFYLLNGAFGLGAQFDEAGTQMTRGDVGAALGTAVGAGTAPSVTGLGMQGLRARVASQATQATAAAHRAYFENLTKATGPLGESPTENIQLRTRAKPYLSAEHQVTPIADAESLVNAHNAPLQRIEATFDQAAAPFLNDPLPIRVDTEVAAALNKIEGPRATDLAKGQKAVKSLGLSPTATVGQAKGALRRLNAELTEDLAKSKTSRANLRAQDPTFVAKEAAAASLRNGLYDYLAAQGVEGIRQLRLDEGALLESRAAAQRVIHKGPQSVGGQAAQSLPLRMAARGIRYAVGSGSALTGGLVAGPVGGAAGFIVGLPVGEAIARKAVPSLTRDALIRRAFADLPAEAPNYPTVPPPRPGAPPPTPPRPVPSHPVTPAPPSAQPSAGGPPRQPLSSLLEMPDAQAAAPVAESPAAGGGPVARSPAAEPAPPVSGGVRRGGRRPAGPPARGVDALPESERADFHRLVPFAKARGFTGSLDDLADIYRAKLDEAREIQRATALPAEDAQTSRNLLAAISKAGGFSIERERGGGMSREVTNLLEDLHGRTRDTAIIKRGPRAGTEIKLPPRQTAGLPGAKGIVNRKDGMSADKMREHLELDPRWAGEWDSLSEFLEKVKHAVFEETQGTGPTTTGFDLHGILRGAVGVTEDARWWEDRPAEDFNFGANAEGKAPAPKRKTP